MNRTNKKGFTLTEVIIVVIILGVIAGFAIPQYAKAIRKAHERDAIMQLKAIHAANDFYKTQTGKYTEGDLDLSQTNNALDLNLVANGMTYRYASEAGITYRATAALSSLFSIQVEEIGLGANNPCCIKGSCPSLPNCAHWSP